MTETRTETPHQKRKYSLLVLLGTKQFLTLYTFLVYKYLEYLKRDEILQWQNYTAWCIDKIKKGGFGVEKCVFSTYLGEVLELATLVDGGRANKGEGLMLRLGETKPDPLCLSRWRRLLHAYNNHMYIHTKETWQLCAVQDTKHDHQAQGGLLSKIKTFH